MLTLLLLIFGLVVGSFLNVLIDRIPQDESPFKGRSYCDKCKKTLRWYDLIPFVSFIMLLGKCRYCSSPISFFYPLVEFITGILFVAAFVYLKDLRFMIYDLRFFVNYLYYIFILSSFIVIFFSDLKYGIIPDKIVYSSTVISFLYLILNTKHLILSSLLSGFGAFIFFLVLYLITREKGMGLGDVKLSFLLGLVLGFPKVIIAFYLAFLTGAVIGFILIIWGKKKLKSAIPFGPFLILGAALSIFFAEKIIHLVSPWLSF